MASNKKIVEAVEVTAPYTKYENRRWTCQTDLFDGGFLPRWIRWCARCRCYHVNPHRAPADFAAILNRTAFLPERQVLLVTYGG